MSKILIVEDEEAIADLEKDYLELSGFQVEVANDGATGLRKALDEDYDMFILDLMLPGIDGFDICRQVRDVKNTPIIMVSAKKDDIDKIRGLGLGADDYMTKPFSLAVLRARIKALIRRGNNVTPDVFEDGEFYFDFGRLLFTRNGQEISLSVNEQRLLRLLLENRGRVLTRSVLVDRLWSDGGGYVDGNALSVTVNRLRSKLEDKKDPASCIRTVYGQGYMWKRK